MFNSFAIFIFKFHEKINNLSTVCLLFCSKENNQHFRLDTIRCKHCSFRTESELALAHHMETPHMKNGMYRCNYCHYDTKLAHEVVGHMQAFHEVRPRLERAPALHSCPQCPFEDMMKGKLTRHKVGCDKRFRPERNQEPPHDWDPPGIKVVFLFSISREKCQYFFVS